MPAATGARRESRPVHGLLLLDKPAGLTSNRALQVAKRLLGARKAGHTGSLDPAATGMLPLCFGEATKVCSYLLDADKCYRVVARLGQSTDTGDADGCVTANAGVPAITAADWRQIFARFEGEIEQVPPMYSALKHEGKRLYELARRGEVVEREARRVRISALELIEYRGSRLAFRVCCSKGTYVRTLVEDLAAAAGTIGHTLSLRRESVAGFEGEDMVSLETLERLAAGEGPGALEALLLPIDRALAHWPARTLDSAESDRFEQGQAVPADAGETGGRLFRAYREDGRLLGIGQATGDGRLAPKRLFRLAG